MKLIKYFVQQNIRNIVINVKGLVTFLREFNYKLLLFLGNQRSCSVNQSGQNGQ